MEKANVDIKIAIIANLLEDNSLGYLLNFKIYVKDEEVLHEMYLPVFFNTPEHIIGFLHGTAIAVTKQEKVTVYDNEWNEVDTVYNTSYKEDEEGEEE